MEVDPESPPFYGFESDTADTSTSEIFEDPPAPPEDEATVEGEKSEPTPTPTVMRTRKPTKKTVEPVLLSSSQT